MNRKVKISIIIVIIALLASVAYYFLDYNHADETATKYLNGQ